MAGVNVKEALQEAGLAAKFAGVGLIGLAVDAAVLTLGLRLGIGRPIARFVSLALAMQVTFAINRKTVFCCEGQGLGRQWLSYMLTNGFGNTCNYLIFLGLGSLHGSWLAHPAIALPISALCAYLINFAGARLIVFGRDIAARRAAR